jgi:hypothetical protein
VYVVEGRVSGLAPVGLGLQWGVTVEAARAVPLHEELDVVLTDLGPHAFDVGHGSQRELVAVDEVPRLLHVASRVARGVVTVAIRDSIDRCNAQCLFTTAATAGVRVDQLRQLGGIEAHDSAAWTMHMAW